MASIFDDTTEFPALERFMSRGAPAPAAVSAPQQQRNFVTAGISSGIDQFQGLTGRGLQAAGDAVGWQGLSDYGRDVADRNMAEAAANGRPDLEGWPPSLLEAPKWAAYQAFKNAPTLVTAALAARFLGPRATKMVPAGVAGLAARVPAALSGPGLRAGMTAAEKAVAMQAGARLAGGALAAAPALYPQSVGSMYQEAVESGTEGRGTAIKALALGVPYTLMESVQPALFERLVAKGTAGKLFKRVAVNALAAAPSEGITEGIQTGIEQTFRPDLTTGQKIDNVVQGAVTGAVVGGIFGGIGGLSRVSSTDPSQVSNDDLKRGVDEVLTGFDAQGRLNSEQLGTPSNRYTQQPVMEGVSPRPGGSEVFDVQTRQNRPLANTPDAELQQALAAIERRAAQDNIDARNAAEFGRMFGEQPAPARRALVDDMLVAQQIRQEMDLRQFGPQITETPAVAEGMRRDMAQGPAAGRLQVYEDVAVPTVTQPAPAAPQERVDTRARFDGSQPGFGLFDTRTTSMEETRAPRYTTPAPTMPTQAELTAGQKLTAKLLGEEKAAWAKPIIAQPAVDEVDSQANVLRAIMTYESAGRVPPKLIEAGKKIGIYNDQGLQVDLPTELAAARAQAEELWRRARDTGQGQKQAVEFQNTKLKKLEQAAARVAAAQARMTQQDAAASKAQADAAASAQLRRPQAPATPPVQPAASSAAVFSAPGNQMKLAIKVDNPATTRGDTAWLQKQQAAAEAQPDGRAVKGSLTAWTERAVEVPLDLVRNLPNAKDSTLEGVMKVERLTDRVQKNGWKPQPISIVVNHRGEAFIENGNARVQAGVATGQKTIPVNVSWMNGAEQANSPWAAERLANALAANTVPAEAQVAQVTQQPVQGQQPKPKLPKTDAARAKQLAQIENDPTLSPELRNAASEARAALEAFQPGATTMASQVLKEYAERTDQGIITEQTYADGFFDADPDLVNAVKGMREVGEVAEWLAKNAKEQSTRVIMRKIIPALDFASVYFVGPGDIVPGAVAARFNSGAAGLYWSKETGERVMYVHLDRASEATVAHELLHAATNTRIVEGMQVKNQNTELARVVGELFALRKELVDHYNKRLKAEGETEELTNVRLRASLNSALEMSTYAFTDPAIREFYKTTPVKGGGNLLTKFVDLVRQLFNIPQGQTNALTRLIDLTEQLVDQPSDVSPTTRPMDTITPDVAPGRERATPLPSPQEMLRSTENVMASVANVQQLMQSGTWKDFTANLNKLHIYTSSLGHIVNFFGELFTDKNGVNWLKRMYDSNVARGVAEQRLSHLGSRTYMAYEDVARRVPKEAEDIGNLMDATVYRMDPSKTWDEHTWLHNERNIPALKERLTKFNTIYNRLARVHHGRDAQAQVKSALSVYQDFVAFNETQQYAQQAMSLHNLMTTDEGVAQSVREELLKNNPMDVFLNEAGAYEAPTAARDYWQKVANDLMTKAKEVVTKDRGLDQLPESEQNSKIVEASNAIWARVVEITAEQTAMKNAPYFHIGRFGNNVLSFSVKKAGQVADPAALERIADAMAAEGITGMEVRDDLPRANVFARFEDRGVRDRALAVATKLRDQGLISDIQQFNSEDEVAAAMFDLSQAPQWMQRLRSSLKRTRFGGNLPKTKENETAINAINSELSRHIDQFFMNMLPSTAVTKVMVHRNFVHGFSPDMIRAFVFRGQVGGRALANLYASAQMSDAMENIYDINMNSRGLDDPKQAMIIQNVATEVFKREAVRPQLVKNDWIDTWRAVNHAYFLGLSPSYVMVNFTQIPVLLWPELAKKYGYVNSAKAIAKVTPTVVRVFNATIAEAFKHGWKNLPDATITKEVLARAGVRGAQAEFILKIVNSGIIDIGSPSRELGRIAEGRYDSKTELALRYASSFGYYSEMASRLLAAMSAKELHGGSGPEMYQYVTDAVRQSMLSYETWNQARATGRMGLAGDFTPIMTSFMQYTFQLTEKLHREFHTAFMKSTASAAERTEARRFLGAHLAAITTLAGSLGMPMATVFARVMDKMVDLMSDDEDEPFNSIAAYRNWLASIFGKDVAEVIARGVPRVLNVDISERVGEQHLLPYAHAFSKLMTDRRTWEDATKDWALQTMGSPVGMVTNILNGGEKLAQGKVWDGVEQMVPNAIKGPVKAYRLTERGYVDGKGNALPMEPGALEIMGQLLGFSPASKAEYNEERGVMATLRGNRSRAANVIRNELVTALQAGDMQTARAAYKRAIAFDRANPDFAILPRLDSVLKARQREAERAQNLKSPLGTKPGLADRATFGNY